MDEDLKPVSQSQHQVIRVAELAQLVARMQKQARGDECFQCQYLVKALHVFSFINKVVPDAEIDAEYR